MQKNSQNFSMEDALRLANSDAGKQLLAMLKRSQGATLQQALQQAASGDLESVRFTLSGVLTDPELRELLKELGL